MSEYVEVIIIDDCSTDQSKEVARRFVEENHMNAHIFLNAQNFGVAYSRNCAIEKASGEYIMFLDSDDTLDSDFFENIFDAINDGEYDMLLWGFNEVDEELQLKQSMTNSSEVTLGKEICKKLSEYRFQICIGSYMIRKEILIDNNIKVSCKYKYGEDQELNYKCLLHSRQVKVLDKSFYNYRYNPNSAMNISSDFRRFDTVESRKELLQYLKSNFIQEIELIERFQNFLIPEAIITVTRVMVYSGIHKKNLKEYWKNRGYAEILKESAREKKLSKNLYLEMMMQMYTWSLYSVLCKLKKHVRR